MIWEVEVRKTAYVDVRVEANTLTEALDLARAQAQELDHTDWDQESIDPINAGRAYDHQENAIRYDGDFLVCECGNNVNADGFITTDAGGVKVEPEADKWDGKTYRCDHCGSVKSVEKVVV